MWSIREAGRGTYISWRCQTPNWWKSRGDENVYITKHQNVLQPKTCPCRQKAKRAKQERQQFQLTTPTIRLEWYTGEVQVGLWSGPANPLVGVGRKILWAFPDSNSPLDKCLAAVWQWCWFTLSSACFDLPSHVSLLCLYRYLWPLLLQKSQKQDPEKKLVDSNRKSMPDFLWRHIYEEVLLFPFTRCTLGT